MSDQFSTLDAERIRFATNFPPEFESVAFRVWDALQTWRTKRHPSITPDLSLGGAFGIVDDDLDDLAAGLIFELSGKQPETSDTTGFPDVKTVKDLVKFTYEMVQRLRGR